MNGLAQLAVGHGYQVTGSDRGYDSSAPVFRKLEALGVRIVPQDGSGIDHRTEKVVYSTAIESGNPDLLKAEACGAVLVHRAAFLNELIDPDAELIAVAGTAGKTTTTGMLGWIFDSLGLNPSVYSGAAVLNWKTEDRIGNVRIGSRKLWIIEADESDKSFLSFHPTHTIITNIFKDHYELEELRAMFDRFESQTSGITVRGQCEDGFLFADSPLVNLLGKHNQENARCALQLCAALGMDVGQVRAALKTFKGVERRLECVGGVEGIRVFDDYAHNPAKIAASLFAASECGEQLWAFWRPHGFAPLFSGMDELVDVFSFHFKRHCKGSIFVLPVYYAGGTVERKATSVDLVERLVSAGVPAVFVPDYFALKQKLESRAGAGDTILGMGARDPELPLFLKKLVHEWKKP